MQNIHLQQPDIDFELPSDVRTFEIVNPQIPIPPTDTTYWCTIHRMPDDAVIRKNHIIQTEPIISPENRAIIHHMEVFHCELDDEDALKVEMG